LKKVIFIFLLSLVFSAAAYCGQVSRIELSDGSVINGEITSLINGVYTVKTANLGNMNIEASKISLIKTAVSPYPNSGVIPQAQSGIPNQADISGYGQKLMGNPDNAAVISGLANDPQIQAFAQDPQIEAAVKSGDIQALMKNPKFMDMVNNPKIQESIKKIKKDE